MKDFEPEFMPPQYKFKTAIHATTITELGDGRIHRLADTHPRIDFAVIMVGGNDLDNLDDTQEQKTFC